MASEQQLITQWRSLPSEKQEEVIDFVAFLSQRTAKHVQATPPKARPQFQQLRAQIVAAGIPLLSDAEIEQEVIELRGGDQEPVS
jgi:hypothetical protein